MNESLLFNHLVLNNLFFVFESFHLANTQNLSGASKCYEKFFIDL